MMCYSYGRTCEPKTKSDSYWDTYEEKLLNALSLLVEGESNEDNRSEKMLSILNMKPYEIASLFNSLPPENQAYKAFDAFRSINPGVFHAVVYGLRARLQEKYKQ